MSDWFVRAGRSAENFDRFKKEGIIAVDYGEKAHFDLSGMSQDEINAKLPAGDNNGEQLYGISMIKRGDMIAVTGGSNYGNSVKEFGIATSDYYYSGNEPDNWHRVKLEYLDFGTDEFGQNNQKGVMRDKSGRIAAYFASQNVNDPNQEYFLLRYNGEDRDSPVEEQWKQDKLGERYHFGKTVGNHKKLRKAGVGTKTIWFKTKNLPARYFWGYGSVKEVKTLQEDKEWNVVYDDFKYFEEHEDSVQEEGVFLKRENESIKQQIENLSGFSSQISMLKITKKIYEEITGDRSTMPEPAIQQNLDKFTEVLKWIPNLILYGPPGTGKTYHAKEIAKELTSSNKSNRSFEHILTGTLQQPADIHQMSDDEYRDFVIDSIKNEAKEQDYTFTEINTYGQYSLEKDGQKIHIDIHYSASTTQNPVDSYVGISQTNVDFLKQVSEDNRFIIIVNHSRKNFVVLPYSIEQKQKAEFSNSTDGNWDPTGVNAHSFHIIIDADKVNFKRTGYDCKKFMRNINMIFSNETIIPVTFHPSFSYEDFIEGFRPDVDPSTSSQYVLEDGIFKMACNIAKTDRDKKIVIIIDEINRGNIPKIFGELISLIENDKRGPNNSLKLVYSKENFFVPKNLYIIGTMNTADKSLVQMDEALRRRFAFEELMPDAALLDDRPARKYKEILVLLNKRIVNTKERMKQYRDKQIGHSYFLNMEDDEDLRLVIKYQIIPLLQDYFYDDYEEIKTILGNEIIGPDNRPSYLLDQGNETKLKDAMLDALKDKAPEEPPSEDNPKAQVDDNE